MKPKIRRILSLPFLFSLLLPVMAHATEFLENGVPYPLTQAPESYTAYYMIDVPAGAQSLTVTIRDGSGDLDLLLKHGSPAEWEGSWSATVDNADAVSITNYADETIQLTPTGNPPLTAGTWYVTTFNWNTYDTSFTLTATVSGTSGISTGGGSGGIPAGFTITDSNGI